jgi:hypothetical protein
MAVYGPKLSVIMVDARNVSILSSDIKGHNRIGSRDKPASGRLKCVPGGVAEQLLILGQPVLHAESR